MKKIASLLLSLLLVFCVVLALPINASAASTATQDGLEVTITTDKTEYTSDEDIQVSVNIKNNNSYKVEDISIETLVPEGLVLKTGNLSATDIDIEAGASYSASVVAQLSEDLKANEETKPEDTTKPGGKDQETNTPQTGDNSNIVLWVILLVVSAVGIILTVKFKKTAKVMSLFLCFAMVLTMLPMSAFAAENDATTVTVDKTITVDGKKYSIQVNVVVPNNSPVATCVVTFNTNGGSAVESQTINKGATATIPATPEKEGFAFVGWYVDSEYSALFDFTKPVNSSCTVFARWVDVTDTTDTDGDGLTDAIEEFYGTNISLVDTDADGLSDYLEIAVINYNPLSKDTDNDGALDGQEDCDNDGIENKTEVDIGTDPALVDTDGDAVNDKEEIDTYNTNPVLNDTDEDGVSDGKEIELGTDPLVAQASFNMSLSADNDNDKVTPSVEIELSGEQVETLRIDEVNNDNFFPETMPGYMGKAYDFNVDGKFSSATISFEFDSTMLEDGADPVICYFNEETQELEELATTINGNIASATVTHFSKYILIDRKVYNDSFTWTDVWDSDTTYTDVEIILVIDDSGSMDWNDESNQRLEVAKTLIDQLPQNSKIGIVRFASSTSKLTEQITTDKDVAKSYLTTTYFRSSGGTYMYSAINSSFSMFESTESTTMKMMVVLSDGNSSGASSHNSTISTANNNGVKIYTVGLGDSTSYFNNYLKPLATNTGGAFYLASDAEQLADIYKNISEKIDIETDSDTDGIPDYYEDNMLCFNGVKLALDKNNPDTDGDGIKDGEEVELKYEYNTDRTQVKVTGKLVKGNPAINDSDGDGYIDSKDENALVWDVSDRDLAMFAALTYETPQDYSNKSIDDSYFFLNYASANEVYDYWHIVDCSGERWADIATHFYATTYKNGNNIVIAYRGTDGEWGEWVNNVVGVGLVNYHSEEGYATSYANKIANQYPNCNIYITGHSLGGYLAQFGASEIILNHNENNLKKVAYFNGIGLKYNKLLFWTKNDVMDALKNYYNGDTNNPNLISYNVYGDVVSALGTHSGSIISYLATSDAINQHKGKYGSGGLTDFLSKSAAGWLTILSSENIAYYYNYYDCSSVMEYFWITHETDSFFYHLTAGTRNHQ